MEKLKELKDITLIPCIRNKGWGLNGTINFFVKDKYDSNESLSTSLPIITSPMESIINKDNWSIWRDNYIKPIIPRTESLKDRLDACCYIFSAFSIEEVKSEFLNKNRYNPSIQYHICIDAGNGHDVNLLTIGSTIKKLYEKQVILMGGNIDNPQTYIEYAEARFDYVRVGMSSGSIVNKNKYGFHYPMASLLMDIRTVINTTAVGLKPVKIIADGGITCCSDVLKAIALGADYVMIGREFAKTLEAAGTIYQKRRNSKGKEEIDEIPIEKIYNILKENKLVSLKDLNLIRMYQGNTEESIRILQNGYSSVKEFHKNTETFRRLEDAKSLWVGVDKTLKDWLDEFRDCVHYGFMMCDSGNWKEFSEKVKFGIK